MPSGSLFFYVIITKMMKECIRWQCVLNVKHMYRMGRHFVTNVAVH